MQPRAPQPNLFPGGGITALSGRFWLLLLPTGIGAGLAAGGLMLLLRAAQHLAWAYRSGDFLSAVREAGTMRPLVVLAIAGTAAGVYRWMRGLNPGGHGGELAEAIWFHSGEVPVFSAVSKSVLSIVIVGMGAALGREAAPKQTGAAIASLLAAFARLAPAERRLLAACGAGAGMGAVYNVPFGGALFAIEVLLGSLSVPLAVPALAASAIATAVSWLILPIEPTYTVSAYPISAPLIVWALLAGPAAGLVAVLYIRLIARADAAKPGGWLRLASPVAMFAVLRALAIPFPELLGNGKDVVQEVFVGKLGLPLLAALLLLRPLMTAGCLGSGAPGGLFTPTMTVGALFGAALGRLWGLWWPGAPPGSYAIVGAAAMLAAAMQGPVCAVVLTFELTGHVAALAVPLILAIAGAAIVARRFEARSIYSARIHIGRQATAAQAPRAPPALADLISRQFDVISAAAPYSEVARQLLRREDPSRPLYVVDEKGRLEGAITVERAAAQAQTSLLETATAADLAEPLRPLRSCAAREEALRDIAAAKGAPVPLVDAESGRLIGAARIPLAEPKRPRRLLPR
jgi:CIC family chloride channel protein